jgi:hypothetical protein
MLRRVVLVRTDISEKRRFLQEPHGVTSQKTAFFIVTAVKTSNLTYEILILWSVRQFIYIYIDQIKKRHDQI